MWKEPDVDLSPTVSDEAKFTTCYMCACRCGIKVHLRDGRVRYIEGNPNHPVNKGVLCGKGSSGIMQHYSPARLRKPLKRVGERGKGEFVEIEWDEALAIATEWLGDIRRSDPKKLAFFTGRDQSQSLTGWWASQFGTPNFAAHGGFCSVNMAAAGLYTIGGSFWEFGEPDWERTKYLLLFGVAEDHDSNPIKAGLGKLKARGAKFVSINPVRTGYSAIADEWIGIRPGTDGLFVLALIHELLHADNVDLDYLVALRQCALAGRSGAGRGRSRPVRARRRRRSAALATSATGASSRPGASTSRRRSSANSRLPTGARRFPSSSCSPSATSTRATARTRSPATCGVRADAIRRIAAEIADVAFEQTIELDVALDRLGGAPARQDRRPAGRDARDARHLRPFQRLPHLPRDPSAADAARRDRLPRRLPLQAAVPEADSAGAEARRQDRSRR